MVFDETGVPINGQTTGVVISDSGLVLPVLGGVGEGWRVWTPCANEADITAGTYVASVDVVLDPGHGGPTEPGATSPSGAVESDLNLQLAQATAREMEASGYSIVLTRADNVRLPIVTRAEIARALSPKAFISIHLNAGTKARSAEPGTEVYHQISDPESRRLAGILYEDVTGLLGSYDVRWVSLSDAGAMSRPNRQGTDYYGVLRRPGPITSVLLELAYVSNRDEAALLATPEVQQQVAETITRAFTRWVDTSDPGSGFTDNPMFRGYGPSGAGSTIDCVDPELE